MQARELRELAKNLGIRGYSSANKAKLIELLETHEKLVASKERFDKPAEETKHKEEPAATPVATTVEDVKVNRHPKVETPPEKKPHKKSLWNQFLADYRAEHGGTLKEAMTKKAEYESYKAKHTAKE